MIKICHKIELFHISSCKYVLFLVGGKASPTFSTVIRKEQTLPFSVFPAPNVCTFSNILPFLSSTLDSRKPPGDLHSFSNLQIYYLSWFSGDFCLVVESTSAYLLLPLLPSISFLARLNKTIAPGKEWNLSITSLLPRACSLRMTQPVIYSCSHRLVPSAG